MRAYSRAVVNKLFRRKVAGTLVNRTVGTVGVENYCPSSAAQGASQRILRSAPSASAQQRKLFPTAYMDQSASIDREQRMRDAGLAKPPLGERLIALRVAFYNERNVDFALSVHELSRTSG